MLDIEKYLSSNLIKSDEYGRMIIEDPKLLEKINGASADIPGYILSDSGCGNNLNCGC